jgi:selenocysteine lyase/cysteine desulfurase
MKPPGSYLDTASASLMPQPTARAVAEACDAMALGSRGAARWDPIVDQARTALAAEFGVAPADVEFMTSAGEAINAICPWP